MKYLALRVLKISSAPGSSLLPKCFKNALKRGIFHHVGNITSNALLCRWTLITPLRMIHVYTKKVFLKLNFIVIFSFKVAALSMTYSNKHDINLRILVIPSCKTLHFTLRWHLRAFMISIVLFHFSSSFLHRMCCNVIRLFLI